MEAVALTDRAVAAIEPVKGRQQIVRDSDLSGFFVVVGSRSKTFMIQADLRTADGRQSIRMKIGEAGRIAAREARGKAKLLLGQIADGIDPRPKPPVALVAPPNDPTLASAWSSYRASHLERKGRSDKTVRGYADHVERLLADWLDTRLSALGDDPSLVKARHDALTAKHGPFMANSCMRTFRAIYNHARKSARSLPAENPVFAVDWNPEKRRDTGLGPDDLPAWFDQLRGLDNPLRRELHLLILLSGSRPDPIKKIRLEHVDLRKRQLFVPNPKGGEQKAFVIPLSRQMMRCILRAARFGRQMHPREAQEWLFPAESGPGHIYEHKEDRAVLSHWGNDLRQTYRTMGQVAGINEVDMHLLINHSLPGVNAGYITRAKLVNSHLRLAQQTLSDNIIGCVTYSGKRSQSWPHSSGKHVEFVELPPKQSAVRGNGSQKCSRNLAVFRKAG